MIGGLLLALAAASAAPAVDCDNAMTQTDMTLCAGQDYQRADAALNAQWKTTYAYMKALDAADTSRGGGFGYAAALLESQRAWLKYRDTYCVVEGGHYAGGSMQPMVQNQCLADLTRVRTDQLKSQIWDD